MILPYRDYQPQVGTGGWVAPNATLIGDVVLGEDVSLWYNTVVRGDVHAIRIGARTNIQDNSVLHVDGDAPCILGEDVTIGHMALVHGTTVGDGTLVGMKSTLLSRSVIGAGALIAAGAVVLEGMEIPDRALAAGVPAKIRRELSEEQSAGFIPHAGRYVELSKRHNAALGE